MRIAKPSLSLLLITLGLNACVTPGPRRPGAVRNPQIIEKEGQKNPDGAPLPGATESAAQPSINAVEAAGLWSRVQNLQNPLSEDDIRRAAQLYPTPKGSLEEAIFVMTQLRMLQGEWEKSTAFESQDLHTNQASERTSKLSLERRFQDVEMDLNEAFRGNTHLSNKDSLALAKHLANNTSNSENFKTRLLGYINERGREFGELTLPPSFGSTVETTPPAPANTNVGVPTPADPAAQAPAIGATGEGASDLMGSDALLLASQKFADKGDYKSALDHVNRITAEDPYFAQAQEKKKQFSNRAVKDLRQRAAEAFSNAIPLSDSVAKATYLRQAKNYLEQALRDYPSADQLDTVKENLEAVNRDLSAIDKTGT